jgi:hypothetical protein
MNQSVHFPGNFSTQILYIIILGLIQDQFFFIRPCIVQVMPKILKTAQTGNSCTREEQTLLYGAELNQPLYHFVKIRLPHHSWLSYEHLDI